MALIAQVAFTTLRNPRIDTARQTLKNAGGGELVEKGEDGKIRAKDTIAPATDPFPPRG